MNHESYKGKPDPYCLRLGQDNNCGMAVSAKCSNSAPRLEESPKSDAQRRIGLGVLQLVSMTGYTDGCTSHRRIGKAGAATLRAFRGGYGMPRPLLASVASVMRGVAISQADPARVELPNRLRNIAKRLAREPKRGKSAAAACE